MMTDRFRLVVSSLVVFWGLMGFRILPAADASVEKTASGTAAAPQTAAEVGVPGGLCVQLGAARTDFVAELARTGRYLVHVLDARTATVTDARQRLSNTGLYGAVSVDRLPKTRRLPYTENLVNLLILSGRTTPAVPLAEIKRVLRPLGVVLAVPGTVTAEALQAAGFEKVRSLTRNGRQWLTAHKAWPKEMDEWSHPRHGPDGNAVSNDTLVGPPRRIRWLAGPWQEVSNMVTAGGRNFYAGVLTRDSFNGLRLWEQKLSPSPSRGGFSYRAAAGSAPPVAGDGLLFVFSRGNLQALDAATGKTVKTFADAGQPQQLLYLRPFLIAVDRNGIRVFDVPAQRLVWKKNASLPRCVVAGDGMVAFIAGNPRRGQKAAAQVIELSSGKVRWQRDDFSWAAQAVRSVYHQGLLTFEVSTLNDDGPGNAIHLVSARDGREKLDYPFLPGMNHRRQARAMFIGNRLWLLHGGKDATKKRQKTQVSAIDLLTGKLLATYDAGLAHCFPPVATTNYLFSGEFDLTDLRSGRLDANRITKAACGRDSGWVPANGLIYVTPKHCVCWPMLRGYSALAPARPGGNPALADVGQLTFRLEKGVAPPEAALQKNQPPRKEPWPVYRRDPWRSGSTPSGGPARVKRTLWTLDFGPAQPADGPLRDDWKENPFVKGPLTAPVIAGGKVFVARPDAHEVVAIDAESGSIQWRFIANGRVDTPPTIHRGMCLFGSKSGWVYCLRAEDGQMIWRMQAAPLDERIVAYGQLESPWPVPGSVLVVDDVAYFAAGRQPLADGGILVFAVEPATGKLRWVQRLNTVPQKGFYRSSGLEFDNFDLLHREGDAVAMSRWLFRRDTGKMSVDPWKAFARLNTGKGSAMVPQGSWSYAPRHQKRTKTHSQRRPLVVFRDNTLFGCTQDKRSVYRRDFHLEQGEKFNTKWITGWAAGQASYKGGEAWRSQRLAKKATWKTTVFGENEEGGNQPAGKKSTGKTPRTTSPRKKSSRQPSAPVIVAMVLAGDKLYVAGSSGELKILDTKTGKVLSRRQVGSVLWDGLAIADGKLYLTTSDGRVMCVGD